MEDQERRAMWIGWGVCLAIVIVGWAATAKELQCACLKPAESQIYGQLSWAPIQEAADVAKPTPSPIGVVRLVYTGAPRYVALPLGEYTLDLTKADDVVRCGTCSTKIQQVQCAPRNVKYVSATVDSRAVPLNNGVVTFTLNDVKSHTLKIIVEYECWVESCSSANCRGTYTFGFKRANAPCQCGTYGFSITIKNTSNGASTTVVRPKVFADLDGKDDTAVAIGAGLNLQAGTPVEIQICGITGSCYCRDGFCSIRFPGDNTALAKAPRGDLDVKFTDAVGCSKPSDGRWNNTASCYLGTTELKGNPGGGTSVYAVFQISYKCEASPACEEMLGFCKQTFKILFVS